jgi:hypothetical protein
MAAAAASSPSLPFVEAAKAAIQAVFHVNACSAALFAARAAVREYTHDGYVQSAAQAVAFAAGRDAVRAAAKGNPRDALRAVQSAARGKIWKSARDEAYQAVRAEFAAELLRLCRLEGEYGELGGDALWDCP